MGIAEIRQKFPQYDDLSDQQLADNLYQRYYLDLDREDFNQRIGLETPREEQTFIQRVGGDIAEREEEALAIRERVRAGEIGPVRGGVRQAGQAAQAYLGTVGEAISQIIPDPVEEAAGRAIGAVAGAAGQLPAVGGGTIGERIPEELQMLKEQYPELAEDIEAVFNIALVAAPARAPRAGTQVTPVGRTGERLTKAGKKQAALRKRQFADDLILPEQTKRARIEQVGRTAEEGVLGRKVVELTPQQHDMAAAVNRLKINPKKTFQHNYNVIAKAVNREASSLKRRLHKNDVFFPRREYQARLDAAVSRLAENPLITGDAEKTAMKIVNKMKQITGEKKSSASGLLQARKELDAWMKSQKGKTVFDPDRESAISIAIREIRNETNDFIDTKATNVAVKKSLKKQSDLLNAMDNIAPKAASEADNAIARLWQNTTRILPLRGEFNQTLAALAGVGGLGASAKFAPTFTKGLLLGLGTYGVGKAATSPQMKKALGALLQHTDKVIRTTKDKALISQLRADRALLLEVIEQIDDQTFTDSPDAEIRQGENQARTQE